MCPAPLISGPNQSAYDSPAPARPRPRRHGYRGEWHRDAADLWPARLEGGNQAGDLRLQSASVLFPVVPRQQVHERIGVEGRDLDVFGKPRRNLRHGIRVRPIERGAIRLRIRGVALIESGDQGLSRSLTTPARSLAREIAAAAGAAADGSIGALMFGPST